MKLIKQITPSGRWASNRLIMEGELTETKHIDDDIIFFVKTDKGQEMLVLEFNLSELAGALTAKVIHRAFDIAGGEK